MPNPIKYTTGSETLALKKGNFYIGTGDVGKGPSNTTGYYNGVSPSSGGYVIYMNKSGAPGDLSYHNAVNDSELISFTNNLAGQSFTTVNECLTYYAGQTDKMCMNRDISPIQTQNLKIHIDPGFVASYPQNGTSFKDMITNVNGTLYNGVSFVNTDGNGVFSFDGVDDYGVILESTPSWLLGDPSFTVCGYFKKNGDWNSGGVWGIGGSSGGINSWNSNNTSQITIDYWGSPTYTTGQEYSLTQWKFCSWRKIAGTFNKTNISIFVNDVEYTGNNLIDVRAGTRGVNIGDGGVNLAIAGRYESYYHSKSVIGLFSIYDTSLSNNDIIKYYNATKGRFGL